MNIKKVYFFRTVNEILFLFEMSLCLVKLWSSSFKAVLYWFVVLWFFLKDVRVYIEYH